MILSNIMRKNTGKSSDRSALLIYCTRREAERIKAAAKRERRTITGFVMNAVMNRLGVMDSLQGRLEMQNRAQNPKELRPGSEAVSAVRPTPSS